MKRWRDREEFKARVLEWAAKLDVKAHAIYVRPMRSKWASCSTAGTLSFNDELLGMDRSSGTTSSSTNCSTSPCPITASCGKV